jgi:sugar lactone lactonase YvrE
MSNQFMNQKSFIIKSAIACALIFSSCKKDPPGSPQIQPGNGSIATSYKVNTFAGNGTNGNDPQTGGLALLYMPADLATDAQGNIYVADSYNDKIRKITPSGVMTTFAGSTLGYEDGTGAEAKFNRPTVLALDSHGNLYVGESGGLHIRKITPDGIVTTIAGNGTAGLVDGVGASAQIDIPGGMVVDAQGNVYFTQTNFNGIRKISPSGVVSTFVGSETPGYAEGTGTAARFNQAFSLVIDAAGYLYVSDNQNARIRRISPAGVVTTFLKRNSPNEMYNITIDETGNFYIVQGDSNKSEIVQYDTQGRINKIAGGEMGYQDGTGDVAKFGYITGMTTDADGALYVSDLFNNVVRKIQKR